MLLSDVEEERSLEYTDVYECRVCYRQLKTRFQYASHIIKHFETYEERKTELMKIFSTFQKHRMSKNPYFCLFTLVNVMFLCRSRVFHEVSALSSPLHDRSATSEPLPQHARRRILARIVSHPFTSAHYCIASVHKYFTGSSSARSTSVA